jgi:hypothetical protein
LIAHFSGVAERTLAVVATGRPRSQVGSGAPGAAGALRADAIQAWIEWSTPDGGGNRRGIAVNFALTAGEGGNATAVVPAGNIGAGSTVKAGGDGRTIVNREVATISLVTIITGETSSILGVGRILETGSMSTRIRVAEGLGLTFLATESWFAFAAIRAISGRWCVGGDASWIRGALEATIGHSAGRRARVTRAPQIRGRGVEGDLAESAQERKSATITRKGPE